MCGAFSFNDWGVLLTPLMGYGAWGTVPETKTIVSNGCILDHLHDGIEANGGSECTWDFDDACQYLHDNPLKEKVKALPRVKKS